MVRSLLTLTILLAAACGAPGEVVGEVDGERFSVSDSAPELRVHRRSGNATIVMAEEHGETLRTVALYIEGELALTEGEPITLGEGIELTISEGLLEVFEGSDKRVVNSRAPTFHEVVAGEVMFTSLGDPIEGELWAELADGGFIEGTFILEGSLR